ISLSGDGYIDDVRIYPEGAQMTTYTFELLKGISSISGLQDQIIYYEYDEFNRLKFIRDEYKNIVKKICYNFNNEIDNCECIDGNPIWQNTSAGLRCQKNSNIQNTGFQEQQQENINPCSITF